VAGSGEEKVDPRGADVVLYRGNARGWIGIRGCRFGREVNREDGLVGRESARRAANTLIFDAILKNVYPFSQIY